MVTARAEVASAGHIWVTHPTGLGDRRHVYARAETLYATRVFTLSRVSARVSVFVREMRSSDFEDRASHQTRTLPRLARFWAQSLIRLAAGDKKCD